MDPCNPSTRVEEAARGSKVHVILSYIIASPRSVWAVTYDYNLARSKVKKVGARKMVQQINVIADEAWQPQVNLRTH